MSDVLRHVLHTRSGWAGGLRATLRLPERADAADRQVRRGAADLLRAGQQPAPTPLIMTAVLGGRPFHP